MTQIDLCALKQKMAYELSNLIPQSYSEATLFNALDYLSGKGYLAQATPTDDLVLCRRVVKGDTTKYYDYVPVDTDKVEAKATTSDYAMSSLPLEIKQKIWSDAAKVEVQAPEAGTLTEREAIREVKQLLAHSSTADEWLWTHILYALQRPSGDDLLREALETLNALFKDCEQRARVAGDVDEDGTVQMPWGNSTHFKLDALIAKLKERLDK